LVILGNPPYQKDIPKDSDNKTFAAPIYHKFLEKSWEIADKVIMIHPARCLFNAGATPKDFNKKLLQNEHLKVVDYEPDSSKIFPRADIKGGVAITYFDKEKNFGPIDTFTPFPELNSILHKVCIDNKNFQPFSEIISARTIYRLSEKFHQDNPNAKKIISAGHLNDFSTNIMDQFENLFFDAKPDDGRKYAQIYGWQHRKRACKYFRQDWLKCPESFYKYKILLPAGTGSGSLGEVLSTPIIGLPLVGCTETFITVGAFDSEVEARACLAYIKSKFCRAMLGILKVTQRNSAATWAKVPLQDFSATSDIDWTKKISEIDAQLYEKYSLSAEEIKFIETHVKAMS
ncbi:MAG: Eco57I restriction-modification methylase domain-containing protein, partial [Selenomonadaceae bacterium]|nr:Eco57I restriction-modification methylase domain-containing protein [Selenomonadaceae bacterium]